MTQAVRSEPSRRQTDPVPIDPRKVRRASPSRAAAGADATASAVRQKRMVFVSHLLPSASQLSAGRIASLGSHRWGLSDSGPEPDCNS